MANILNVYDTEFGNTREVANIIDQTLSKTHTVVTVDTAHATPENFINADFVIIGSPVHYWKPTRRILLFLASLFHMRSNHKWGVAYDTRLEKVLAGSCMSKLGRALTFLNVRLMSKGEAFFVDTSKGPLKLGEMSKAEMFAKRIDTFLRLGLRKA